MKAEAQRIAIAEACPDWTVHHGGLYCAITNCRNQTLLGRLFDPLTDANAQFEAWKTLSDEQKFVFRSHVSRLAGRDRTWAEEAAIYNFGEAFLKTISKWED